MKKLWIVLGSLLLAGCATYETIKVEYVNNNRDEIIDKVLEKKELPNSEELLKDLDASIDVYYYELEGEGEYTIEIANSSDYYYTGNIEFEECKQRIEMTALPPYSSTYTDIVCPAFNKDGDFFYQGKLYDRKEEYRLEDPYEFYYYEEDDTVYDYVFDKESLDEAYIKKFADYLFTEMVLVDLDYATFNYLYTKEKYDAEQYDEAYYGYIWVDPINDFVEIYDSEGNMVERINHR